jgi:hypothetical protein
MTGLVVSVTGVGGAPPDDYGDRADGALVAVPGGFFSYGEAGEGFTPAVEADLFSSEASPTDRRVRIHGESGYGDLLNVLYGEGPSVGGSETLSVVLTADPGVVVDLHGFSLAGYQADYTIAAVEVWDGATPLFSETDVLVEGDASGPGHTTFVFDPPLQAAELLLRLDVSNLALNLRDNVAIDDIRFGQIPRPAPEPARALLLAVGLALGLALRLRAVRAR